VTYVAGLVRGWRDAGFDDQWILEGTHGLAAEIRDSLGDLGEVHLTGPSSTWAKIAVQQTTIPMRMLMRKPDVLLCTTPVVPMLTLSTPVVAVVHDLRHLARPQDFGGFQNWYREKSWAAGLRRADRLIADSERTRRDLQEHYPFTQRKVQTVYLGSDHVPALRPGEETGHGIAFARWANKRPDFAIQTWAALKGLRSDLNRRLHLVGVDDDEKLILEAMAHDLGIAEFIVIHSFLPEDQFWELFGSAGVVLFPSFFEGFGLPVLEAMRLGVPVVTWRDPAIVEVAGDCVAYADPSPDGFARLAERLLWTDELRNAQVARAYKRAVGWTWRLTAFQTRSVLVKAAEAARLRDDLGPQI